jgi:hypothetical protein
MSLTVKIVEHESVPWMVRVVFNYDDDIVSVLREIPGAIWDNTIKCWVVPMDVIAVITDEFITKEYEIHVDEELLP